MIRKAEQFLGIPLGLDEIVCDNCGVTAHLYKAIGAKTWHVGQECVSRANGERIWRARHQCAKCIKSDNKDKHLHFPLVSSWYFIEEP